MAHPDYKTDLNEYETGGQFGRARVAPGFTVHRHAKGHYFATSDRDDRFAVGGCASVVDLVKLLAPDVRRATGHEPAYLEFVG